MVQLPPLPATDHSINEMGVIQGNFTQNEAIDAEQQYGYLRSHNICPTLL